MYATTTCRVPGTCFRSSADRASCAGVIYRRRRSAETRRRGRVTEEGSTVPGSVQTRHLTRSRVRTDVTEAVVPALPSKTVATVWLNPDPARLAS